MTDPTKLDPNALYHLALSDEERAAVERTAHNFRANVGRAMQIPPALYEDLKRGGVNMKDMEPDPRLENWAGGPKGG